jgi:hypothetical protein
MRRGQAAIEYLIILAVVVIIALIVIGVIGGFPGMTRGISERDSAAYWASADIGITRYYLSNGTTASQLVLRNNRLFAVNVSTITFDGSSVFATATQLSPGSSTSVNLTAAGCVTVGQSVTHSVVITYKDATYGVTYTFTGEKSLVGTCQND